MRPNNELSQTAALLFEELRRYDERDQAKIMALLSKPENFGKRISARNYWMSAYADRLGEMPVLAKAKTMETAWKRYLVSARWQKERKLQLLPRETEFPYWYLHVISKQNEEKALCCKMILKIIG